MNGTRLSLQVVVLSSNSSAQLRLVYFVVYVFSVNLLYIINVISYHNVCNVWLGFACSWLNHNMVPLTSCDIDVDW